jgi:hypothetical protein
MRGASAVGRGRSQVALLRFAERRSSRRCSEPPRNATEGTDLDVACQFNGASGAAALEKTDLSSKPVVGARRSARRVIRGPRLLPVLVGPAAQLFR